MIAVFHRELKACFTSLRGTLFLGLYLLATGLFMTLFNFVYGYAQFEYTLSYLTISLGCLLPILTVPMYAAERRQGGDRLLRALPLRASDVVLGKYLAGLTVLLIVTAVMAICPVLLGLFAEATYVTSYAAILGFFLLGHAFLTLELFLSETLRRPAVAYGVSFGVPILLAVLARVSVNLPEPLLTVAEMLSLFGAYTPFVFGLFDLRAVVLYLSVSAVFLILTLRSATRRWER